MARIAVEEAVAEVRGQSVPKNVNTGDPLVTQPNARAYLQVAEKKLGH